MRARQRLIRLAGRRYTQEGEIVLRADEHREQGRNRLALGRAGRRTGAPGLGGSPQA